MCPHEITHGQELRAGGLLGYGMGEAVSDCVNDPRIEKRSVTVRTSCGWCFARQWETGTPFAFNRDSVNRMNPNVATGNDLLLNLCTEIAQFHGAHRAL